jgi:hypothetical protein
MPESIPLRTTTTTTPSPNHNTDNPQKTRNSFGSDITFDDWDEQDHDISTQMPSDLRPDMEDERAGRSLSAAPLLGRPGKDDDEGSEPIAAMRSSTHTFHERDPETQARLETRRKYTYAGIFLALSLVSFTVQTETAVYIQHELKWEKPYCML